MKNMKNNSIHNVVNISINCEKLKEIVSSDGNQRDESTPILYSKNVIDELPEDLDDVCMVPTPVVYKQDIDDSIDVTDYGSVLGVLVTVTLVGMVCVGVTIWP